MSKTVLSRCVQLSKRVLYLNINYFVLPYFCILIALSAIFHWIDVPPTYWSNSKNVFNILFMKYTYWYILLILLPFVFSMHLVFGFGKLKNTVVPLARVLVNFFILFVISWLFNVYGSLVGSCSEVPYNNKEFLCTWFGFTWTSFDISGHIFHNMYGLLAIMEEASYYKVWDLVEHVIDVVLHDKKLKAIINMLMNREISTQDKAALISTYQKVSTFIKINFCALAVLAVLLHIANLITVIYFHTVIENTVAAIVATILWFTCYRVVFPLYGVNENSLDAHVGVMSEDLSEEDNVEEGLTRRGSQKSYASIES